MRSTFELIERYSHIDIKTESLKIVAGAVLLFACGQIAIPLRPVPITLTTVAVMLIGLVYSRRNAILAMLTYFAAGAVGLPVFQGFVGGLKHFSGSTAGYICGFFVAVVVMTTLREKFGLTSFFSMLLNCTIGTIAVFIPGVLWLSMLIGREQAITFGVLPFILPGIIKAFVLCGFMNVVRKPND